MKSLLIQTFCLLFLCLGTVRSQQYQLASPNGKLSVTVDAGEALTWQIAHDGTTVLQPSAIALQGRDEKSAKKAITFGKNVKVIRAERKSVESSFPTPLYKKASVEDVYNQLTLKCRGGYSVQFRAYDDGAVRWMPKAFPTSRPCCKPAKGKGSNTFTYQRTPRRCAFRNFSKITGHAFTSATHASSRA